MKRLILYTRRFKMKRHILFSAICVAFLMTIGLSQIQTQETAPETPSRYAFKFWRTTGNADTDSHKNFLGTTDPQELVVKTNGREALRIDTDGNVGIGTTHPQVRLHNAGDFITEGPQVDVRAHGAKGDGTTDDTSAIQEAINSLPNGGVVFFPTGTYKVTATLNLTSSDNVRLIGNGWDTAIAFESTIDPGILIQKQGCAVINIELRAPLYYASSLIRINDVAGITERRIGALIERVKFTGQDYYPGGVGIELTGDGSFGLPWNIVRECYFYLLEKQIKIGPSESWLNGNSFLYNTFDIPKYAVYMDGSLYETTGNIFIGNHVQAGQTNFEVGFTIDSNINTFLDNHVWDIPEGKLAFHILSTANRTMWIGGGSISPAVFVDEGRYSQVFTPYTIGISQWIQIGIGTYEPEADIHLKTEHPQIMLEDTVGEGYRAVIDGSGGWPEPFVITGWNDYPILKMLTGGTQTAFYSNNAERIRISDTGNVGIGTENPTNILTVVQGSATDPIADSWGNYSSRRWKTNIQPLSDALEKVQRLRGVSFDLKANGQHDIGLIAEEVGKVIPEVVTYEENGVDAKSVDYARLVALLIEGMKAQQQQIDTLKRNTAELAEIKAENAALKQRDEKINAELDGLKAKMAQLESALQKL